MPTPKFTPGAQLFPLNFAAPAFKGLNTELAGNILSPEWATQLENAVFDETGRPAARDGWLSVTSSAAATDFKRIFEYLQADGVAEIIASSDSDIYEGLSSPTSVKDSLTITDGNIKFVNFNDKCIAFGIGASGVPAVYTGSTFASITVNSGTAPDGTIGTSAFGRVWGVDDDGKTIRYSALLDETRWAVADGGGLIDMSSVWPDGQDTIVAITEFMGDLIVFGRRTTVIMTDGQGAALGIDPTAMYVSDTIPGVGAVSQFAICKAAGDLWVLSRFGVVGLRREITQKSTPYGNISKNIQSGVTGAYEAEVDPDDITMFYSPAHSMVVVVFPTSKRCFTFDTRIPLEDGSYRATSWNLSLQTAMYASIADTVYGALTTATGEFHSYTGKSDSGDDFTFDYESGWLDLGAEQNLYLKFVKRLTSFVFVTQNVQVTHKVMYDFDSKQYSLGKRATGTAVAEYNESGAVVTGSTLAEYNEFNNPGSGSTVVEYGGGVTLRTLDAPLRGSGQYIKIGLHLNTEAGDFVLQQINLYAKIGRLST